MKRVHDFVLLREEDIVEYKTKARLYRHVKTGAELLSLVNEDENKVFGITFRTPPRNSTGVPHILEHSVLCGSRKYPVKEPFVEILKGSLQTFLNAFTYPDKTCYPVASQNIKDFYNLIDVYLDAVFYPRISPQIFQQEGWHFEMNSKKDSLKYKGVVFNEMKGSYSSPDRLLAEYSQQSLFPDNSYGYDSGGDPEEIPSLTYDDFKRFHAEYYHPSNARIFFYGDDDPDKRLQLINKYLQDFDCRAVDSAVTLQKPGKDPKTVLHSFTSEQKKGMVTVNWLLEETKQPDINMAFHLLDYMLLGMPGSPLRKTLIDSGLGEDLTGGGLESELQQLFFSIGLKGIDPNKAQEVERLIFTTLKKLVTDGFDEETKEAALNTIEFRLRENNTGSFPRGLAMMLSSLTAWLYDGDPIPFLSFLSVLESLKKQLRENPRYFESLVNRYFLQNAHRTTVIMNPVPVSENKRELLEKQKLEAIRATMRDEDIESIIKNTHELKEIQEKPDTPEALATIPSLSREDIERFNKIFPHTMYERNGVPIAYHDLFTNGVLYLDVGFNFHVLPQHYLSYLPLLGRAFLEIGTETEDYVKLSQRISRKTGGIYPSVFTSAKKNSNDAATWFFLRGKTIAGQTYELLNILEEMLINLRLDNQHRFKQMVREERSRLEQKLIPSGHQIVNTRFRSHFSEADWLTEQISGISYLFFLRELEHKIEVAWDSVLDILSNMLKILISRDNMIFNVTVDETSWSDLDHIISEFIPKLPANVSSYEVWNPETFDRHEGMIIPTRVNYVCKGTDLYAHGYCFDGSVKVISRYLKTSWLWERVRVMGGAYGAFCQFDRLTGIWSFVSYRDPNLLETLEVFDSTAEFLRTLNLSQDELTKGIIGAIGDIDTYMLPDAKGYSSLIRHLIGVTEEDRQLIREQILSTTADDFRNFADTLKAVRETGIVTILGSEEALQNAVEERQMPLKIFDVYEKPIK